MKTNKAKQKHNTICVEHQHTQDELKKKRQKKHKKHTQKKRQKEHQ